MKRPKLGDVKKMNDVPMEWGMWDGAFWSRVTWVPGKGWLIPGNVINKMKDHYEPRN